MQRLLWIAFLLVSLGSGLVGGAFGHMLARNEAERQQVSLDHERIAREGKTDMEWYEKHPLKGGSSAQAKTQAP
jgi:hypothetical protein